MKKSVRKSENTSRKMEIQPSTICGMQQSSSNRKVYSSRVLLQETRRIPNNLACHLKESEKEEHKTPKSAEGNNRADQKNQSWYCGKVTEHDETAVRLTKKREAPKNKLRNQRREVTDTTKLQKNF